MPITTAQIKHNLFQYTKGLPKETLLEIIDFIQFIRQKNLNKTVDNLTVELSRLSKSQTDHLEEEFKDYKQLYPGE